MEDQQISPKFGTIVLVGDSRVHHLASSFKSSWPHNSTELVCKESEETHIDSIIYMIEEELSKTYASDILIVVLGFHCDIMMLINHDNESNVQMEILRDLVKKIHSATERWKKLNPVYNFLWCLPSVPDFKRYNKNNKKYIPYKEQDILEIQKVRKYFYCIKELKLIWENIIPLETTVLLDLNMIGLAASSVADPLRKFAKFEDLKKLPTFVASQTIDGLHLTPKMAVSFWNCVSNCASQSFFGSEKVVESTVVNKDLESVSNKRKMVRIKQMDFSKKISTKVDLEVVSKSLHEEQASSQQDDLDCSLESKNKDDLNILSKIPNEEQTLFTEDEVDNSPESYNEEYISPSKDTLEISSNCQNQVESYCMDDESDYSLEKQKEELVSPSKDPLDTLSKIKKMEQSYCMEDVDYSLEKQKEDWVSLSKGTFETPSKSQNKVSSIECKLDYSSENLNEEHVYSVDDENLDVPSISLKVEQLKLSLKSQSSLLDKLNLEHEHCSSTNIKTCTHLEKDKVLRGNFISFKDQKDCSNITVNDVICLADYSTNEDKIMTKLKEEDASVSNIVLHNDKSSVVLQKHKKKNSECNSDDEDFFAVDESDDNFFREVCDVVKEIDKGAAKNKTFLPIYVQKNDSNRNDSVKVTDNADAVKKAKKSEKRKISFLGMEEDTKLSASKDALESANIEEMVTYHQDIEKIVKLQDNRIQNNIVIVTDDRDNFDVTLNGFNTTKVTVLKVPSLKMSNAFSYIQAQYLLGKGTIFVFCCGTHDLTLSISLEDCLAACCPSPLTMLTIPYKSVVDQQFLVNTAVKLNMDILVNTENDIAIFCGLIPVRIAQYNDFAANNRQCGIFHPVNEIPHIAFFKWNKYKKTIFTFNTFITDHANKHKFRPWNLDRSYYSIEKTTVLLPNFYNITPEEEIRRANQVKLLCTELLLPRCSNSALINPLNEMTTSQKLQDNVKPEDEIFKYVVLNQLSLYKEEILNIKIMQEGRVQRFIVIVTDDRDNFQEHFSNYDNRISILKEPRLRLDAAFQLIKMHPKFGKGTIFVFLCGIADLLDYEIAQECLTYTCPYPQGILTLQENDTHCLIKKALKLNKNILQTTMSDVALFSGIVPIDVNYFNTYIANKSKDHSFHQKILLPNTDIVSYVRYREAIAMYSNFIKYHAQNLGFSPWDLEQSYYSEDGGFRVLNQSGYSLCPKELVNRADQAKLLCTEMLLQSCTKSDIIKQPTVIKKITLTEPKSKENKINLQSDHHKIKTNTLKFTYQDDLNNIVNFHKGRIQNKIVIVTDDIDIYEAESDGFDTSVTVSREPGLKLSNAFASLSAHPNFGKGTIFVFCCGTHDLVYSTSLQDCLLSKCPYPQTMLSLPEPKEMNTNYLINVALQLSRDILRTTQNDIAMFCGLIPVNVRQYNKYTTKRRPCKNKHLAVHVPKICLDSSNHYETMILTYNCFAKNHAQAIGQNPWDFKQLHSPGVIANILHENGYNVVSEERKRRAQKVKVLCTSMLLSTKINKAKYNVNEQLLIKTAEEESLVPSSQIFMPSLITAPAMGAFLPSTIMDPMTPTVNIPFVTTASMYMSSIISAPFVPAGQIISSLPSSAPYVPVSSMYEQHPENTSLYSKSPVSMGKDSVYSNPSLALGSALVYSNLCVASKSGPLYTNTDSPLPLLQIAKAPKNLIQNKSECQINQTYDQVAIIADYQYASFIQKFAERPEVVVLADFKLKVDYLEDVIKAKKDYLSKRTLYLLVFGVHSVTKIGSVAACQQKRCTNPLQVIEPLTYDMIDRFIDTEIRTLNNVVSKAKLYLPAESNIEILPPLPVSLISLNIGHENLHRSKSHFPDYLIAKRIDILEKIFPLWMKKISVLANSGSSLLKCCKVFPTTSNKLFYIQDLQVMNCVTEEIPGYNQWKEVIKNIVSVSLDLHLMEEKQTSLEISTNDDKSTDIAPLTSVSFPINRHLTITTDKIIIKESVVPGVKKGLDNSTEFAKTMLNMKKDIRHSSAWFKNAFIVSNHQISWMTNSKNPFAKSCFESKFIYHALINYDEGNIKTLLRKMGSDLHSRSLCCFMFDLSIFGIEQNRSARSKYFCPLQHIVNTVEPNPNVNPKLKIELELFIENKLLAIEKFIQQLGKIVPVVILPIVPARIYCYNGNSSNYQNHKAIKKTGAYIVQGSDQVWKFALEAIVSSWNHFMKKNNREIDNYNYITTYTENNLDTFTVCNDLNDFKSQWTQPDIWMAFIETFIASLVDHLKSFRGVSSTKRMAEKTYIAIQHISPWIPFPFMMELFTSLDDKAVFELNNDRYKLRNVKLSMVLGLIKKLNSFRFGASKIKAVLVGDDRVLDRVDSDMMLTFYISSVFEKVYLKWKSLIAETIVQQINDVPDLATVKVNPCQNGANCKGFKICPYYHTPFDLRRNPLIYSYDLRMCLHQKSNYATCYKSEADCELSRNSYETKFHPSVYQVTRCPSSRTSEACNKIALCPNAHLDSPELFFTADWNDLIVVGADRTLEYFTGAIRSAKKVEHWYKLRIMLISISLGFLDFAISVSRKLLERYSLKACILGKDLTNSDSCEVLLGNPGAFLATNADDFKQAKGTIIIDDIERMLMNEKHLEQLTRFVRRVTSSSLNLTFNIVIVNFREDFWPNKFVNKLTKRFGLKYMEDPSATSDKSSDKQNYSAESTDKNGDFSKGDKRCKSKSYDSVSRKRYRRSKSKTVSISSSDSDSKSYNLKAKKRIDSNSSKASRRSHSKLMTPPKRSSSESMSKLSMSMLVADTARKSSISDTIEVEIRNRLGNKLYEEYVKKIEILRIKFDQEFSIFKNVPELCPHYEYCFNNFDSLYSVQHIGKSKDHKKKLWELYWVSKLEEIKQNEWEVRLKNVVEEYYKKLSKDSSSSSFVQQSNVVLQSQKKAGHYDLTSQSSIRQSYRMDENKREFNESVKVSQSCIKQSNYIEENERTDSSYEFTEALSMLERLCDLVGFLGPSLSAMVATCRELGTNTKEAYSVFTSMENVMVINMILEKVKILRLSATRSKLFLLATALDWIPKLLEEAKNGPSTPKTDDSKLENLTIDIKALAKVSLGKSSEFALQLIETALAYEGVPNPPKELVNKLYLKVCEIHFRLSVDM